jgi:hypothetical protein
MDDRIRALLQRLNEAEDELRTALHEQESRIHFRLVGKRVEFREGVRARHRALRMGWARWIATSSPRNVVSAPFIYGLVVPFAFLDLALSIYQAVCFPLYRIPKARRGDYIVLDRHQLGYLNFVERLNCSYCAYANGLVAWAREIAARTEQYWCPIKHARKVLGAHGRYARFLDYGDGTDYQARLAGLRAELAAEREDGAA